ncbi:DgyrCDS5721 [Dimorphilus gyrociliatus]|uniref:DgyrCDS5721 n=1 Tax=Dimorphilus gyrociliatus TaxID=2664684 RepID=A0A7I8VMD4_9ANNE|nr:DgyrCDS5721 [Dimorphilus gyrociliatus]
MQRILFIIFYATWILLHNVYGTITGRKGTQFSTAESEEKILMPGVHPSVEDEYFCIGKKLHNYEQYITSFEALGNSTSIHHLLLYGCKTPYSKSGGWWKCGAICGEGGPSILYAWAKNAPPVQMPPNVGFHVGGKTPVSYIVMQIHYKHPIDKSQPGDKSGVKLKMTTKPQKFLAGIYILMRYLFTIPAHSSGVHSDVSCRYSGNSKLYPFAFRVHAHSLGRVISAYQYNDTGWHKLGKGNPQWPQAFYPINENLVIKPGDRLVARCTFDARNRNTDTHIGSTHNDEMCNFYLMYYTPATVGGSYFQCGGDNIPRLSDKLPDESDSPLPPNPLLENWATGILSSGRPASHSNAENYDILYDYYDVDKPKYDYYYDSPNFFPYPSYRKPVIPNVQRKPLIKQPLMQRPHHDNMVDHGSVEASRNRVTEKVIPEKVKTVKTVSPKYVKNWPKAGIKFGQISGIGTDSKGNVHIFHRADRIWDVNSFNSDNTLYEKTPIKNATILIFDPKGNLIKSWGSNMFYMPHGLHVDKDDNVWVTDVGSHQVKY